MDRCKKVWTQVKEALTRTAEQNKWFSNRHRSEAPKYEVKLSVLLSAKEIQLKDMSHKMAPRYIVLTLSRKSSAPLRSDKTPDIHANPP